MPRYPELNERAQHLLKVLVERYIQDGQPVGSRSLAREAGLNLSPATIRNVMADLEEMGLVASPHTSAGRIPTVKGYRFFVDSLLTVKPLQENMIRQLKADFGSQEEADELLATASKLLSSITRMAGVVTLPRRDRVSFRHIEFLSLSEGRVLVILVINEQEVHNKIIRPSKAFSTAELQQAANYLNRHFEGKDLSALRATLLKDLQETRARMNQEMLNAIEVARLAFEEKKPEAGFVLSGETNLMDFSELADMERLRQLFEAFSQKQGILHLLDQCLKAEGIQIFIGEESGFSALDNCSLVTSSYSFEDRVVGVLGVIGPTRMHYARVIPFVDVTAKLLSAALNHRTSPPSKT